MRQREKRKAPRGVRPLTQEQSKALSERSFDPAEGYVGLADYCMIAPDAETPTDPDNAVSGCGS